MLHTILNWVMQQPHWLVWTVFWSIQFIPALLAHLILRDTENKIYMWYSCMVALVGCGLALPFLFVLLGYLYFYERDDRKNKGVA
jgi:Na+-driven multidrug efflux pump